MCCLKYEQEAYEDLIRTSPKVDSFVDTPEGRGTVVEIDLLRQRVKVRMEEEPETISVFANADIAILRNGKAKKTDPPIPADLAPISGSGKRIRKETEENSLLLEPIRFKYSTERIVEEPEEKESADTAVSETGETSQQGRRRRRRGRGQSADAPKGEPLPKAESVPKEKKESRPAREPKEQKDPREGKEAKPAADSAEESAKKHRRRNSHRRHHKPKQTAE